MRAKKAKRIRKEIYGDASLRSERIYMGYRKEGGCVTVRNHPESLRAKYQQAKRSACN